MAVIRIPKTPKSAYNPDRKASDLLRAHVRNLEKAVGRRSRQASGSKLTEGEAAAYIRELGRELHQRTLLPEVAAAPTIAQTPSSYAAAKPAGRKKTRTPGSRRRSRKGGHR